MARIKRDDLTLQNGLYISWIHDSLPHSARLAEDFDMSQDHVSDIAFTPAVKAEQGRRGSREGYRKMAERQDWSAAERTPVLPRICRSKLGTR